MIHNLIVADKARIPVIWFVTHEEQRAEKALKKYASNNGGQVWIWSLTSTQESGPGWQQPAGQRRSDPPFDLTLQANPKSAIASVIDYAADDENKNEKIIVILRDPHAFFKTEPSFTRILRDAFSLLKGTKTTVVCISPEETLPSDLKKSIEIIHPGLPSKETLRSVIDEHIKGIDSSIEYNEFFRDKLAEACCGLTLAQTTDSIGKSLAKYKKQINLDFINQVKTETISAVPGLTFIGETPLMEDIGGLAGLKEYLDIRKDGFSPEARAFGLPAPKGLLTLGISGCGKSLFAKAVASAMGLPLISLNLPDVKGGIVGETEKNFRQVKESLTAVNQCVLWIDELEKALPKAGQSNSDGGTSDALLQGMLNWMQERKGEAFIIATANSVDALPPELLRKGRWDTIFFVDLPTDNERRDIIKIHLKKIKRTLCEDDIQKISLETKGYSGAELEAAVVDGLWLAFQDNKRDLRVEDILSCIKMEIPLSKTMAEKVKALRLWAKDKARPAAKMLETAIIENVAKEEKLNWIE